MHDAAHPEDQGRGFAVGTVYGALLNDVATVERLASAFREPPYKAPPVAPVLYLKSRNTLAADGAAVAVPASPGHVRVDATVGAVIGRRASRVAVADASSCIKGWVVVADLTLPHASYYRPAVRSRCRDGFCPMGAMVPATDGFDLAAASMSIAIDGIRVHERAFARLVRDLPTLIADITAFLTLEEDDVVLVGPPEGAPLAAIGSTVRIDVPGLGSLTHTLTAEGAA